MAKKQVESVKQAVPAPAASVKARTPRITAAKHKSPVIVESPLAKPELAHEAIANVAYGYWESRGYQGGDALDDWFRAEAELGRTTIH